MQFNGRGSDADLAVLLSEPRGERVDAVIDMAGIAFDVLLDTGVLVQALPLWEEELKRPELFSNPCLIENIRLEWIKTSALVRCVLDVLKSKLVRFLVLAAVASANHCEQYPRPSVSPPQNSRALRHYAYHKQK